MYREILNPKGESSFKLIQSKSQSENEQELKEKTCHKEEDKAVFRILTPKKSPRPDLMVKGQS